MILALKALSVTDLATNAGPAAAATAATVTIDRSAPTATAPSLSLRSGVAITATAFPVTLAWTDNDAGVGIARYELAKSTDGGTVWTAVSTTLATASYATTVTASGTVRFRVRAVDRAGNIGAWATGPVLTPSLVQQTSTFITYTGTWTSATSTSYSGGSVKYASVAGRAASYTFTGRSVAFVTTRAASRGSVKVYVDGVLSATVSTYSATTAYRVQVWAKTWTTSGTHTVKLVVVGTAGHPHVDLDAISIVK